MSQDTRGHRQSKTLKRSVKAARKRAETGLPLKGPKPSGLLRPTGSPKGIAISKPAPMPQWPLTSNDSSNPRSRNTSPQNGGSSVEPNQGNSPPRRPQRLSYVSSILDASKIQNHTPAFQYRQQQPQSGRQDTPSQQQQRQQQSKY